MALYILTPDATVIPGIYANTYGTSTIHGALGDGNGVTYCYAVAPAPGPVPSSSPTRVSLTNPPTIPIGAEIRRVQAFVAGNAFATARVYVGLQAGGQVPYGSHPARYYVFQPNILTDTGAVLPAEPLSRQTDGTDWTQAALDGMHAFLHAYATLYNSDVRVSTLYVEVETNERPAVTLTGPASLTPTSTPTILWTYSDAESEPQEACHLRIFTDAVASGPGFNPLTSQSAYDSTLVYANIRRIDIPVEQLLPPGAYVAYLRATDTGSNSRWSDWATRNFTVYYTIPPPATLTATPDQANARVNLVIGWPTGSSQVEVQRSADGGSTWETLRWGRFAVSPTAGSVLIFDYEAPLGIDLLYRARAIVSSGAPPALITRITNWSASTAPVTLDVGWWLTDPYQPIGNNVRVCPRWENLESKSRERVAFHEPLGRDRAVWTADTVLGEEIDLRLRFRSEAEYQAFEALRRRQVTLLLRSDMPGVQWYVRLGDERSTTLLASLGRRDAATRTRIVQITATEVQS